MATPHVTLDHFMDTKCSKNKVTEYFECFSKLSPPGSGGPVINEETGSSLSLSENFRRLICKLSSVKSLIELLLRFRLGKEELL